MFLSDNMAPASPEIFEFLQAQLQHNIDMPYGDDAHTQQLDTVLSAVFETEVRVFPVASGTAANCLALSALCPSTGAIVAHRDSHLSMAENTAPHFFTGGAAVHRIGAGPDLLLPEELQAFCENSPWGDVHAALPTVLSLAQATELGRVYTAEHLQALGDIARHFNMPVYTDGARFANAVHALKASPADLSWKAGMKAITFGAIKNGTFSAEALVLFDKKLFPLVQQKAKQAGHLSSKMRYQSAQLLAYFKDDLWLRNATQANESAAQLERHIMDAGYSLAIERQSNQIFAKLPAALFEACRAQGIELYPWRVGDIDCYRLVTSWATSAANLAQFAQVLKGFKAD